MAMNDPLANALSKILNAEKSGKKTCVLNNVSKVIKKVLTIMQEQRYIGEFTPILNHRGETVEINLLGKLNNCGVIKPRSSVAIKEYEKFEKRFLPAKDFGIIMVSTSKEGIVPHTQAKELNSGGRLIAFVY